MTDTMTPQAGWYPDPTDSRAYRWWSGWAWTDHLTTAPAPAPGPRPNDMRIPAAEAGEMPPVPESFALIDLTPNSHSSLAEEAPRAISATAERNRAGVVVIIIGLVSVLAYLGSLAFAYTTILPLIPGLIGLAGAVPAFRRARVTGEGLPISLLGVTLSGAATVLSVLPLLPALLGLPSADEIAGTNNLITTTIGLHTTVEGKLVAAAQTDFGQAATSADCPSDALPTKGSTFSCTETLADGTTKIVNVTVTDDSGTVTWKAAS